MEAVVDVLRRHSMREEELVATLRRWDPEEVEDTLRALDQSAEARRHTYRGQVFWVYGGGRFAAQRTMTSFMPY